MLSLLSAQLSDLFDYETQHAEPKLRGLADVRSALVSGCRGYRRVCTLRVLAENELYEVLETRHLHRYRCVNLSMYSTRKEWFSAYLTVNRELNQLFVTVKDHRI